MNNSGQSVRSDVSVSDVTRQLSIWPLLHYDVHDIRPRSLLSSPSCLRSKQIHLSSQTWRKSLKRIIRLLGLLLIGSHARAKPNMLPFKVAPAANAVISVVRVAKDYIIYK